MATAENKVLQYILNITRLPNKPLATMAGLTTIMEIITSTTGTANISYLLEHGLVTILSDCFDNCKVRPGQQYNQLIVLVALKLTWQLSRMSHITVRPLMTEGFYMKLLKFVDTRGDFFEISDDFTKEFSSLVLKKQLIANVAVEKMSSELSKHLLDNGILPLSSEIPKHIHRCWCFDTTGEKDINISEHMIMQNLAWKDGETNKAMCDNWKDIVLTKIIDKQYFYALIGEGAIRQVSLIKSMMEELVNEFQPAKFEVGKIVVAGIISEGHRDFVRGQVVFQQGDWVKVKLLDHGGIQDVQINQVYELPSALSLMYFPAQATLCYLAGVRPAPIDAHVSQLALASLCNLIKHSVVSGLTLMKTDCINVLGIVLQCPDPALVLQAVRVLNNLSSNPRIQKDAFQQVLLDVLGLMKSLDTKPWSLKLKEELSFAMFSCMANILYMGKQHRSLFYQNEGLSTLIHLMMHHHPSRPVSRMAKQVLRNFLVEINVQKTKVASQSASDFTHDKRQNDQEECTANSSGRSQTSPLSAAQDEFSSSEDEVEKEGGDNSVKAESDSKGVGSLNTVNSREMVEQTEDFYVYDSEVDFCDDVTHELRPHRTLNDVSRDSIAEIACGMLNSRGGTIYFGITKDLKVKGVKVSRYKRDSFRLGVDQMMMCRLSPPALYIQFELVYRQVFQKVYGTQTAKYAQVADLYVVEIRIRKSRAALHSFTPTKQCFYRFGRSNLPLTSKEVRELVVVAEEANFKEEILSLRLQIQKIRRKLSAH